MFSHIAGMFSFYFSGKIIDKFGPKRVLNFEIISNRIVNFLALLLPGIHSPILLSSTSFTFGVGSVAINSLLQKEFNQKQRATMGSLNSLAGNISFGVSSLLLGAIADIYGPAFALLIVQFILLTPLLLYHLIFKNSPSTNPIS